MTKEKKESEYVYLYPLIIMAVGFGKSTQTVEQIVRNQIKQKEIIKYADVEGRRQDYNNTGNGFINHFLDNISKKDLLNPRKKPLTVNDINRRKLFEGNPVFTQFEGSCGVWNLRTFYIPCNKQYDFNINVSFAPKGKEECGSFHPHNIQKVITTKFGNSVYLKWKKLVLDDLDSLRELISGIRDVIKHPHQSVTCCHQSESLCKRVGLPVVNHHAFLVPSKFTN